MSEIYESVATGHGPEGWDIRRLEAMIELLDHKRVPISAEERFKRQGTVPYYGANGQQGWIDDYLFDEPLVLIAEDGGNFDDFASRPIAYKISGKSWVNNHAHLLRSKNGNSLDFIFLTLAHKDIRRYIAGSTRSKLTQRELKSIKILTPLSSDEQTRIAAVLDTVDEAIAKTEALVAKRKQVRAGLLHDLLTRGLDENGQLRDPIAYPEQFQGSPLGRIPRVWSIETLGERLKQNSGTIQTGPFGSQLHAHEYRAEGIPVIMPQDIRGGDFDDTQIARIPVTKAEELRRHRVRRGDLIFARRGDLSRCVAVGEREVGWLCGTGCLLMRFEQLNLSPRWLSLAYRHDFGQRQIAARAVGTTMVNLNTTLLAHLVFAFPRKQEQEDIVRRIDEADATIQNELANVLKLGLLKYGLMNDLLTGRVRVPEEISVTG